MTARPNISLKTRISVIIEQAGGWVRCPICSGPLRASEPRILEHMTPHELGGSSDEDNLRWVHKECASKKTNGSKATSASGDLHKIAKAKRLEKAKAEHEAVIARVTERKPGKIKSRGFQGHRKFNGELVRR